LYVCILFEVIKKW